MMVDSEGGIPMYDWQYRPDSLKDGSGQNTNKIIAESSQERFMVIDNISEMTLEHWHKLLNAISPEPNFSGMSIEEVRSYYDFMV